MTAVKEFEMAFRFNVTTAFEMTKLAVPKMVETTGRGAVVNIGSVAGRWNSAGFAAYGTAKSALAFLTRQLAQDFAPKVRVNCIAVGSIKTDALGTILNDELEAAIVAEAIHSNKAIVKILRGVAKKEGIHEGVIFVLQPNFSTMGTGLRDAYVELHDPWIKTFSLWAGQFNRPNFAVEYSSSKREVPERSRIIRRLYPGERGIGVKLEVTPPTSPLKIQLALLNGNEFRVIDDIYGICANCNHLGLNYQKDKICPTCKITLYKPCGKALKLNSSI